MSANVLLHQRGPRFISSPWVPLVQLDQPMRQVAQDARTGLPNANFPNSSTTRRSISPRYCTVSALASPHSPSFATIDALPAARLDFLCHNLRPCDHFSPYLWPCIGSSLSRLATFCSYRCSSWDLCLFNFLCPSPCLSPVRRLGPLPTFHRTLRRPHAPFRRPPWGRTLSRIADLTFGCVP